MNGQEAVLAGLLAAVERGDAAAFAKLAPARLPVRFVTIIVDAAVNLNDRDVVAQVARLAIAADLPPSVRVHNAWRLAAAGFAEEGLAVALVDPRLLAPDGVVRRTMAVLREVRRHAAPSSLAALQAGALLRHLLPEENPPFVASPLGFSPGSLEAPHLPGEPTLLHAAPGLPAILVEDAASALADFERVAMADRPSNVRVLKEVFVNRTGQIWARGGRVYRAFGRPVPPGSQRAEADAPELPEAVLGIEAHNNIFHWFAEWLPSLAWRLDAGGGAIPILLRDDAVAFVAESLELGAASPPAIAKAGDAVFVRRLHLTEPHRMLLARDGVVAALYRRVRARAAERVPVSPGRPLYISRQDTPKRPLTNEPELEDALSRRGFDIVTMSGLPFAEQVARVDAASIVVGAHGAGLTPLAAARPGRRVVEIVPAVRGDMPNRVNMANISRMVGHRHHLWLERMPAANAGKWQVALAPFLDLVDTVREKRD